jgi:hypothetical protein
MQAVLMSALMWLWLQLWLSWQVLLWWACWVQPLVPEVPLAAWAWAPVEQCQ